MRQTDPQCSYYCNILNKAKDLETCAVRISKSLKKKYLKNRIIDDNIMFIFISICRLLLLLKEGEHCHQNEITGDNLHLFRTANCKIIA